MTYLGMFDQKSIIWAFLGKNFKNAIVIFELSTLKFHEKAKMPKFGTKNALFEYF